MMKETALKALKALLLIAFTQAALATGAQATEQDQSDMSPEGGVVWLPEQSTYDTGSGEQSFVSLAQYMTGMGAVSMGMVSSTNPAAATSPITTVDGVGIMQGFAFFTSAQGDENVADIDLSQSSLTVGTKLKLVFSKPADKTLSFIGMVGDASSPEEVGIKVSADGTTITMYGAVVQPVVSASNQSDQVSACFGAYFCLVDEAGGPFDFKGVLFVTDMIWHDLEEPQPQELPQSTEAELEGACVAIGANGVAGETANFTAFVPEAFFEYARANWDDEITGASATGYVSGEPAPEGEFSRIGESETAAEAYALFDIDGDSTPDQYWVYQMSNNEWSREAMQFGEIETPEGVDQAEADDLYFIDASDENEGLSYIDQTWDYSPWLGYIDCEAFPWVYTFHMGWAYAAGDGASGDSYYFYLGDAQAWTWTNASDYPFLYLFNYQSESFWVWLQTSDQGAAGAWWWKQQDDEWFQLAP